MKFVCVIPVLLSGFLLACSDSNQGSGSNAEKSSEKSGSLNKEPRDSQSPLVLVRVNGTDITEQELTLVMEKTLGGKVSKLLEPDVKEQILNSLVASRAMALLAEKEMSAQELQNIKLKAKAYEEELLAKYYLSKHTRPIPVTSNMVRKYYEAHPEKFGGDIVKKFEYISIDNNDLSAPRLQKLETLLNNEAGSSDFEKLAGRLNALGFTSKYTSAEIKVSLLTPPLDGLIENTEPGKVSNMDIGQNIVIAKVLAQKQLPPQPLAKVEDNIRKMLAPVQLKKSVKTLSNTVLEQVQVEYINANQEILQE